MKSQNLSQSQSQQASNTHITLASSDLSEQNKKCYQKNATKFACITRSCPNQAFLCGDQNCSCQSLHEICIIVKAQRISKNLKNKIVSTQPLENIIIENVDKLIDQLSQYRDKVLSDMRAKFQFFGLTEKEKDLLKALTKNIKSDPSGHQLWLIYRNSTLSQSIVDKYIENIDEKFKFLRSELSTKFTEMQTKLNQLQSQTLINLTNQQFILDEAYNKCFKSQYSLSLVSKNLNKLFQKSKIVQQHQIQKILNFFESKILKSSKLLYRASENNFQLQKFHHNCNQFTNTITFCTTQFDKKIGGFTCLDWKGQKQWKIDQKTESFVFSLTNNDKFRLLNKQRTVFTGQNHGPDFGHDFCLRNLANLKQDSYAKVNSEYFNNKYKKDDKNSLISFSGSQSDKFKVKEWQVWHLQFQ